MIIDKNLPPAPWDTTKDLKFTILQIEFDLLQFKILGGYFAPLQPANFIVEWKLHVFILSFLILDFKNACIQNVSYDRT
jgi:hypothetical protein